MPMFDYLKVKTGQVIRSSWANDLVDAIQTVAEKGAVDYYGYVHKDLIPDRDLALNLGLEDLRFREVHAGYGYFTYTTKTDEILANVGHFSEELTLQGKRVLKDEDPVHIASFYDYAATQIKDEIINALQQFQPVKTIERAISMFYDYAATQIKDEIVNALTELAIPAKPHRVGIKVAYYAPAMADVFDPDITMNYDGRARFKLSGYEDFIAYIKHIPAGFVQEIIAALNSANIIEKDTWAEFDFTVNKDDKVNVRVYPSTTVTVIVYNIPEA